MTMILLSTCRPVRNPDLCNCKRSDKLYVEASVVNHQTHAAV